MPFHFMLLCSLRLHMLCSCLSEKTCSRWSLQSIVSCVCVKGLQLHLNSFHELLEFEFMVCGSYGTLLFCYVFFVYI